MKKLVSLVLALILAMSIVSYAGAQSVPVVINFWHSFGSGANLEAIDKIIADFNALNAGKYEVVGTFQGNYAEILGKLTVGYAADDVPAVSFTDSVDDPQLINMGMLENLSEYAAKHDPEYDFTSFFDGLMNYGTGPDGDVYAIPFGRSTPLMYLNMDIVKEATGEEKIPTNREEFLTLLKSVRDNTDHQPFSAPIITWYFANFLTSEGYSFLSQDGLTSYLGVDDGALYSFSLWKSLRDEGLYVPPPVGQGSAVNDDFVQGKTAVIFQSTGNLTHFMKNVPFKLAAGFLPAGKQYCVQTGGCNMIVPNKASEEEKAGAWEFMKYASSLEVNAFVNEATGYMLIHKNSSQLESVQKLWVEKPLYKVAYDQLQYVNDVYTSPFFAELNLEIVNLLSSLLQDNKITAEDAYSQLILVCDNLFPGGNAKTLP